MNKNFKGALYAVITILIIILIVRFLIRLLPYFLVIGFIVWLIFKFKKKTNKTSEYREENYYNKDSYNNQTYSNVDSYEEDEDFDTSNAIDVDYEDVDNK
ncbi:hypothetical protein [Clostridium thermobutyricum]|uniref:Uncharacterized protein n=1 Tax=Clostridium thermobutyricum DSM 4928 TaxID=1121339 RepID=A0A1V4SXY9_9CLOT|nr:hypothetical protein [Clostridium thermobutyricum]OPX49583.1 hypothetical protein CLTHE_05580 [Clostridium thermobutyricum DSM 4928]